MLSEDIIRADGTVGPIGQRFENALPAQSGSGGAPFVPDYASSVTPSWDQGNAVGATKFQDYGPASGLIMVQVQYSLLTPLAGRCEITLALDPDNNFWFLDNAAITGTTDAVVNTQGVLRGFVPPGGTYEVYCDGSGGTVHIFEIREIPSL